jgi:hypothetical protein
VQVAYAEDDGLPFKRAQDVATRADVAVYVVPSNRTLHRFFDTSPISPTGRYLALFRLPYENHSPRPGDAGEVVLFDLRSGKEQVIASSTGWEFQVGANVQWGASDRGLYFNSVDPRTWKGFAVEMNPLSGIQRKLDGPVFMASAAGRWIASHNLVKSRRVMPGYGVVVPDRLVTKNVGPVPDDGIYVTNTKTGRSRMLVSLKTIYEKAAPSIRIEEPMQYEYHCFQVKWNRQGTRLLIAVSRTPLTGGRRKLTAITMKADGSDIRTAVTADQWSRGGHHIHWHPDGERISMNLNIDDDPTLEIVTLRFDGCDLRKVFEPGSGHPSFHPGGRYLITDAHPSESVAFGDGTVPIRLIDTKTKTCINIARIYVSATKGEFRVDPHPAWGPSGRYVVFNGFVNNTRQVYIADLAKLLK